MKRITIVISILIVAGVYHKVFSQGCVAIKGTAGVCSRPTDYRGWDLNLNGRYFKSYKHFVGTIEQKQRVDSGTNVINHSFELDIAATKTLNSRWSLAFILPIMDFSRSSKYEHFGNASKDPEARGVTHSFGIGD